MRLLSWLTPLVPSPPLVKPFSREVKGCYAPDSTSQRLFALTGGTIS